jgi:hypothetical protein
VSPDVAGPSRVQAEIAGPSRLNHVAGPAISFDPLDPEFQSDPYALYASLREQSPLARLAGMPHWVVTGHRQVQALLRDPRVAAYPRSEPQAQRPTAGSEGGLATRQSGFRRARTDANRLFGCFMHDQRPDEHLRLRRLSRSAFSASRTEARRARIQQLTDDRIDEALARGRLDVVGDLGRPVALTVSAELLGLPSAMHAFCGRCARELIYRVDVFTTTGPRWERGMMAMIGLAARLRELLSEFRTRPPAEAGLLWALDQARGRGEMTEDQVVGHGAILLMAGHITTQHLVGNGVLALLRNPDQWELLRSRPELIESTVEELLRYDTPSAATSRFVREEITIEGETLRPGAQLALIFGAANRDPAAFPEPNRLDITRAPNQHLAFGHDAHFCIGAALARLEAGIVIGTLARRAPQLRLEGGTLEWEDTLMVRGLRSLPTLL